MAGVAGSYVIPGDGDQATFKFSHAPGSYPEVKIDGKDITQFTRNVTIDAGVGKFPTVRLDIVAHSGTVVELSAHVTVNIEPIPGYELILLTDTQGVRRLVCRPEREHAPDETKASRAIE